MGRNGSILVLDDRRCFPKLRYTLAGATVLMSDSMDSALGILLGTVRIFCLAYSLLATVARLIKLDTDLVIDNAVLSPDSRREDDLRAACCRAIGDAPEIIL
jgi:hypothetical protein